MNDANTIPPVQKGTDKKKSLAGILLICSGTLVILLAAVLTLTILFRDRLVKLTVCKAGSKLTGTKVCLEDFSSTLSGQIRIKGLSVGNPPGYSPKDALVLEDIFVDIDIPSLFTPQKLIKSISIRGMQVHFEGDFNKNNLKKISSNIQKFTSGSAEKAPSEQFAAASKENAQQEKVSEKNIPPGHPSEEKENTQSAGGVLVARFDSEKAQVTYTNTMLQQSFLLPLPPLHLTNIGGATLQDIIFQLYIQLLSFVSNAASSAGDTVLGILSGAQKQVNGAIQSTGEELSRQAKELGTQIRKTGKDLVKSFKKNFNF